MKPAVKQNVNSIQPLVREFCVLDEERQDLERTVRKLKKKLDDLKEQIQNVVGTATQLEVPYVVSLGNFQISQVLKHRDVDAFSYDYVEFKIKTE